MDFRTSIDLNSTDKQLVLASVELSTFYCVYASFTKTSNNDDFTIDFSIVNYKGPVKVKINKVVKVEQVKNGFTHFKIFTSTNGDDNHIEKVKLKKDEYLICQRISAKENEISPFLVSEHQFTNIISGYKTPYEIETEEAEKYIAQIKEEIKSLKSFDAASPKLCVVGTSKLI
ncbi:hypothetical protein BW723_12955 [Polaribacter reichenbachii]|uniref:Uncharacterized protein n=1 Tax=Polaribacter reichenbachii TaxID=996801 RepID=A0A1B8U016_9FLAO|nr:hypothetical protein [Polaribacter reichenbachii]APZ47136.1 hypothetical protein BW723_12955 [Polaribacter reichenbachii]OBY65200.1 hypothetical protein LPB301_08825 [Polaribacter reichenbachii]